MSYYPYKHSPLKCGNIECKQPTCYKHKLIFSIRYNDFGLVEHTIIHIPSIRSYIELDLLNVIDDRISSISKVSHNDLLHYTELKGLEAINIYEKYKPIGFDCIIHIIRDDSLILHSNKGVQWAISKFYLNCNNTYEFTKFEETFYYHKYNYRSIYNKYLAQKKKDITYILNMYIPIKDISNIIFDYTLVSEFDVINIRY